MSELQQRIIHSLWKRKDLTYLFHEDQERAYQHWKASQARKYYLRCSRRWGKSFFFCVVAAEEALNTPNAEIRFAAPTQKMAKSIVEPHFRRIFRDAPEDLRPDYRVQDQVWRFPNGSLIILSGVDNGGAERLRGTTTHLALVDEAGLMDELPYVIQDILLPQTITVNGKIVVGSTPPKTPAHPFIAQCVDAESKGAHMKRTIYDAPHITPAMIEEYQTESGGAESTTWKREYLAEFVTDQDVAIIPEFPKHKKLIVQDWKRPPHYHTWVVADIGFTDLSAIGFFYVDFYQQKLVLEDELYMTRTRSELVNGQVRKKLTDLKFPEPQAFIADTLAKNTIADMSDDDISWGPPHKHNAEGALNLVRLFVSREQLIVNPRCVRTIAHLEHGIWNKSRTQFERSDNFGHFDGIDMLKYACRSVDMHADPYPETQLPSLDDHFVRGRMHASDPIEDIYGRRTRG